MIKKGVSGGLLSIVSLLNKTDREAAVNNIMIRTSSSIREAAKVGLQSLYANADEVLEKYKDFDIIKEMKARNGANLLWVRARAIDADVCNANGDYFSEEELLKEQEYQGKKIPAYKTFEGVPIYTNHKNDDIEQAKGMVVYAEWDDEEKCVYCVFFVDEDAYPEIARGIRQGYIKDVSMGCSVDVGVCSICGNKATTEKDYCFAPGALITMSDGSLKTIENIEIGDEILSHTGAAKKVRRLSINNIKDNILKISANGAYLPLIVTQNHPFLGVSKDNILCKRDSRQICKPGEVGICFTGQKVNSGTQSCCSNDKSLEPSFIHSGCLEPGDYIQSVSPQRNTNHLNLTIELAKFAGYYMAEGCLHKSSNSVILSVNQNENDLIEDLEKTCLNLPEKYKSKYKFRHEVNENNNSLSWRWANKNLKNWLKQNCLGKATEKKISKELFEDLCSNKDFAYAFIAAFIDGDGHQGDKNIKVQLRTASPHLTNQLVQILATLNIKASTFLQTQPGGPTNREKICYIWHINISGIDAENFIDKTIKVKISAERSNTRFIKSEYGFLTPIYDIEKFYYEGPVYNFSVEGDESYIANGIAVHNCECLKKYKGRMHPNGKKAFEYNYGIKFIELSCVGNGAFESCEILELYDQEEILEKAKNTIKSAQSLNSSIKLAASIHEDINQRREIEQALRQLNELNNQIIKIAQTAGTLVGGQLLGGAGAQNATVVRILQGLGIDPSSQLNILDLVNLALNFLEVAVLNLFSRKDNIDLGHVAKLTKAMGELQNTLQDMIDDGIETGGQRQGQPMISPPQQPQIPPQQTAPAPNAGPQSAATPVTAPQMNTQTTAFEPAVGKMISPFSEQPYVMPLGGGVSASTDNVRFVWASNKELISGEPIKLNKLSKLVLALNNLKNACGVEIKISEGDLNKSQKNTISASSGDKKIMNQFAKIAQDYKKQNSVALGIDINLNDQNGNRIVLSTDNGIKGYYKGALTNWNPNLSDAQLAQMENGDGYRVAAELLTDFSKITKTAEAENKVDHLIVMDQNISKVRENKMQHPTTEIKEQYHGVFDETMEEKMGNRRHNDVKHEVLNKLIGEMRTDELVRIVTELADDARKGLGKEPLEEMLHPDFGHSTVSGKQVMSNLLNSVVKTCKKTQSSPSDVLEKLISLSKTNNFGSIIKLASLGKEAREYSSLLNKFAQLESPADNSPAPTDSKLNMPTEAVKDVTDGAAEGTTEGDIMSAIEVIKDSFSQAVDKLNALLGETKPEDKKDDMKSALEDGEDEDTDQDAMKGAVTGLSLAGEESGASPYQLTSTVNGMPSDQLAGAVDKARVPGQALARAKNRMSRVASNNLNDVVVGWLADVANQKQISTEKIVLAAKLFCSYEDAAKSVLEKSIRTSGVKVTDETEHSTTIYATLDDLGFDVKDAAFNQKFRDYAVDLLSQSGYQVDPATFSLTYIHVDENGMVTGKVSTKAIKSFAPDDTSDIENGNYVDSDRDMAEVSGDEGGLPKIITPMVPENEPEPAMMTASAKAARRLARMKNVIKVAQGLGLPGAPAAGGAGAGAPGLGGGNLGLGTPDAGMAGGPGDLGLSSFSGGSTPASEDTSIDSQPEPGTKSPWGTICPQCGSKDVDIANGEGSCNSCNTLLKYKWIVEATPAESKDSGAGMNPESMPASMPTPPVGGIGAPGAGAELAAPTGGAAPTGALGAGGAPPIAASQKKVMVKVAYKTSATVYAEALSEGFNKATAEKLPVGMVCPACGSRNASKKDKTTLCYNCNTISVSEIKKVPNEPGVLEASIVWI